MKYFAALICHNTELYKGILLNALADWKHNFKQTHSIRVSLITSNCLTGTATNTSSNPLGTGQHSKTITASSSHYWLLKWCNRHQRKPQNTQGGQYLILLEVSNAQHSLNLTGSLIKHIITIQKVQLQLCLFCRDAFIIFYMATGSLGYLSPITPVYHNNPSSSRHSLVYGLHSITHCKLIHNFLGSLVKVNLPSIIPFGIWDFHNPIILYIR